MNKQEKLAEIDRQFTQNKEAIRHPADLINILKNFTFTFEELKDDLLFPEDLPYGRNVIFRSDNFEAILMNWKPCQGSYIHDHGNSFGVVYVITDGGNNVAYGPDYKPFL
jgi:cysteine dioxygenase